MLILYSIVFVLFVVGIFISVSFLFSLQDINLSQHVYLNKLTKSHNSWKTCSIPKSIFYGHLQDMLVIVCGYKPNPLRGGGVVHTRLFPYMLYIKKMTKSHNSCKTCNIAKSRIYSHLYVMLVTVYRYEQNPSRVVGGVAHKLFGLYVHTGGRT